MDTIHVGGDFQGKNKEVQNAQRTYVGPEASVRADAISEGDGGKVVVWSDDLTRYKGSISVRGGARGGDGGSVEVSGKRDLEFRGTVDASAPNGKVGTLLLDPLTITIANGANGSGADDGQLTEPAVVTIICPRTMCRSRCAHEMMRPLDWLARRRPAEFPLRIARTR